jgi:hypothetical protein
MRSAFCAELPTAPTRHEAAAPDLPRFDLRVMNMRQHLVIFSKITDAPLQVMIETF